MRRSRVTRDDARAKLLDALDMLDEAEGELSGVDNVHLIVVYSAMSNAAEGCGEVTGYTKTAGPEWLYSAMLQRVADHMARPFRPKDD